jgi:DNA-directed RNA polymerase subunit N (RpoN/RPB10)
MESKIDRCHHCGEDKADCYYGFIAMTIPIPEAEALIDKWGRDNWWENLERTDLTDDEFKELDGLNMYDQLLNTVGRGVQCNDCAQKEAELYEKYYPEVKPEN